MKNKKGFTLVELLAVIVVLGIVMGIAAVAITNVLDSTRKNAFVASAKQFVEGAKALVEADMVEAMLGGSGTYVTTCNGSFNIAVEKIKTKGDTTEGDTTDKTPWGTAYDKANSKVVVTAADNCQSFTYAIFLRDAGGDHYIASAAVTDITTAVAVGEGNLDSKHVFAK